MRIAIATDAWLPQVNGVVRTLNTTVAALIELGHEVELITPQMFRTVAMPGYREIRLALLPRFGVRTTLDAFDPDVVHISTEGPIGWSARGWAIARGRPFTTAFHTRFPDYAAVRTGMSAERFWPIMRRFHAGSRAVLAATPTLRAELESRGIGPVRPWSRGIDRALFNPAGARHPALTALPGPVMLNVGRVAPEKGLEAFLGADVPGSKVVIGDGPALSWLRAGYPSAHFFGAMHGDALASAYRAADVFVFPSCSDTFGLVLIEALACGLPVAALPVPGPLDIVGLGGRGPDGTLPMRVGALAEDLGEGIARALRCERLGAAVYGAQFGWDRATAQFVAALTEAVGGEPVPLRDRAFEPA